MQLTEILTLLITIIIVDGIAFLIRHLIQKRKKPLYTEIKEIPQNPGWSVKTNGI